MKPGLQAPVPVAGGGAGQPVLLPLELIDEDPQQPRSAGNPGFSARSLLELAASIRQRGVKTPVSVRPSTDCPGRYIVNHGARRLRASRLAGKATIPAFVDADYSQADQVVENLHRNGLTAREIADYIGRELARGLQRRQIARQISKSAAFVTQHARLLDLPEPVAQVFSAGRVRDVTVVNELVVAYQENAAVVAAWLADDRQEVTRSTVQLLRDYVAQRADTGDHRRTADDGDAGGASGSATCSSPRPRRLHNGGATLHISYRGRSGTLVLNRVPTRAGDAWMQFDESGTLQEVPLADVRLTALTHVQRQR